MKSRRLPDGEFEIMKAIWHAKEPITSVELTKILKSTLPERDWKQQTVMTMLTRLESKGFIRSEKNGKERHYFVVITEAEYIRIEEESFRKKFSGTSLPALVKTLCESDGISQEDIDELKDFINKL